MKEENWELTEFRMTPQERAREIIKLWADWPKEVESMVEEDIVRHIQAAIIQDQESEAIAEIQSRTSTLMDSLFSSLKYHKELRDLSNKDLAELIINTVWSDLPLFGNQSTLLSEAIERLQLVT